MNKNFKKVLKFFVCIIAMIMVVSLAGCARKNFELKATGDVTTIEPGASVQLYVNKKGSYDYAIVAGQATVSETGLLTCLENAEIDSQIIVSASTKRGSSQLTLTVKKGVNPAIELTADSKTIEKGQKVNLSVKFSLTEEQDYEYKIISGDKFAEIKDDKLVIKEKSKLEDIVGEVIVIQVISADEKLVDEVQIEVVGGIYLTANTTSLLFGDTAELTATCEPEFGGETATYTYSVVEGSEYVSLSGNVLKIKDGVTEAAINGQKAVVRVTLDSNPKVKADLEFNLFAKNSVDIVVSEKTFIAGENALEILLPEVYDKNLNLVDVNLSDFTFTSSNEDVVKIGERAGELVPVGHGQAEITVSYLDAQAVCDVYVIVVPEAVEFTNLSTQILTTHKYYYSIEEALAFEFEFIKDEVYKTSSTKVSYQFELLNKDGEVVESGDSVAKVTDAGIKFNTTGEIKVTVTTNSSLNGKNTEDIEVSTSIIVNVNDGLNIHTVSDLAKYADANYIGKAANFINDIKLTENENFGYDSSQRYNGLTLKGDRYFYGNGYAIDLLDLPLSEAQIRSNDLFYFNIDGKENKHTVEIYDLEIIGNYDLDEEYIGNVEADKGKDAYNGSFHRALSIGGSVESIHGICEGLVLSNLKVSNFNVGLRIDHIVDGYVTDINIAQCASNGIELNQNIITLNNIYVGQVGAFAIEMVPDDIIREADGTLHGTAGYGYNETPETKLTGTITSTNYNNGKSTAYMESLNLGGYTIPDILMMITAGKIQYVSALAAEKTGLSVEECQMYFADLAYRCLFKDADASQGLINFFLLVFVNPADETFMGYNKGNQEHIFGNYTSEEEDGNIISLDKILEESLYTLIQGGSYDNYKNYKYILIDLDLTSALGFNVGEVLIVNEAYEEPTPSLE